MTRPRTTTRVCDIGPGDPRHGTINGYKNHYCRCAPCTAANTVYCRELSRKRGVRPKAEQIAGMLNPLTDPDDPRHGTAGAWSHFRCRCDKCLAYAREAQSEYRRRRREADPHYLANRPRLAPDDRRHGTVNGYTNHYCRCDLCRAAHATEQHVRRAARKSTP